MKFRMVCPKCLSANFSIERDNRSYAPRGQMFEMIFSCRCGKQLFGDQIEEEYSRQQAEFEANSRARQVERAQRPTLPEVAVERAPPAVDPPAPPAEAEIHHDGPWREPVLHDDDTSEGTGDCEWHMCDNPPRPNSKYCSRDCSNKNARYRYKKRKNGDKAAA